MNFQEIPQEDRDWITDEIDRIELMQATVNGATANLIGRLHDRIRETGNDAYASVAWNLSCAIACATDEPHFGDAILRLEEPYEQEAQDMAETDFWREYVGARYV